MSRTVEQSSEQMLSELRGEERNTSTDLDPQYSVWINQLRGYAPRRVIAETPPAEYPSAMSQPTESRITTGFLFSIGGAAFVLLLAAFGGGYLSLDGKIADHDKSVTQKFIEVNDRISQLSERTARVEENIKNIDSNVGEMKQDMNIMDSKLDKILGKLDASPPAPKKK